MQKILSLIITAAIIYMIFQYNQQQSDLLSLPGKSQHKTKAASQPEPEPELTGSFLEKTASKLLINVLKTEEGRLFFENILQPVGTPVTGVDKGFKVNSGKIIEDMFKIRTYGEGITGPASCGHVVTVQYKVLNMSNLPVLEKTDTFPLGSGRGVPGLDAVVVGMKTGQTRQATITAKYAAANNPDYKDGFKINVVLKEIMPQNFADDTIRIFDDEIIYKMPLVCGDRASFDTRITRLSDGTVIFDSREKQQKINMRIGDIMYPVIFSHALHGKIPGGTRTVIAQGKFFQSYAAAYSKIFPETILPKDEYYMVDFYDFDTGQ